MFLTRRFCRLIVNDFSGDATRSLEGSLEICFTPNVSRSSRHWFFPTENYRFSVYHLKTNFFWYFFRVHFSAAKGTKSFRPSSRSLFQEVFVRMDPKNATFVFSLKPSDKNNVYNIFAKRHREGRRALVSHGNNPVTIVWNVMVVGFISVDKKQPFSCPADHSSDRVRTPSSSPHRSTLPKMFAFRYKSKFCAR